MKKYIVILVLLFCSGVVQAQMMGPGMMGSGMMGGMMWRGWSDKEVNIPDKLSKPEDRHWIDGLEAVLASEKLSRSQYTADEEKYGTDMPYAMIIPQEDNHIRWIEKMLVAYGLSGDLGKVADL